jgi:hypothetical protein
MFTDEPTTPRRVEILVDVVAEFGRPGPLRKDQLLELVQPETLPGLISKTEISRSQGESTLRAARELELVEEQDGGWVLSGGVREHRRQATRDVVLAALDGRVLRDTAVEPYFTLFYSYLLGLGPNADQPITDDQRSSAFNAALGFGADAKNPFNDTKLRGLWRWFPYAGLGWFDSREVFQCDPHGRLRRALPQIFEHDRRLDADTFMMRLGRVCPELDGGLLFRQANPLHEGAGRVVSLGLSQALVALHEDGEIRLDCPRDSRGWDLSAAEPSNDGDMLRSDRLDAVEIVGKRSRRRQVAEGGR